MRGRISSSSASPDGLEVEEGFITFTSLPGGLLAKVGKLKAQFGKVNTMHSHILPWVDEPLAMTNLLGGDEGLNDSGVSVSKLILNPVLFLEATGEIYNGDNNLFTSYKRSDLTYVGRLRGYRDITEGINLDLGTSIAYGHNDAGPDFTTRLFGIDATVRYRPLRRAIYKRFLARTELFWSDREQPVATANAFGRTAAREYQFGRRWFCRHALDHSERATDPTMKDKGVSLLLTHWPSEFSQIRGQSPPHQLRGRRGRERGSVSIPVFDRRARRACILVRTSSMRSHTPSSWRWRRPCSGGAPPGERRASESWRRRRTSRPSSRKVGGDKVETESLAKGYQDPHFVEAKPSFILRLNRADLLDRRRPRARNRLAAARSSTRRATPRSSRAATATSTRP